MAILITCPFCSNDSTVDEHFAGNAIQCPHCNGMMQIHSAVVAVPAAPSNEYEYINDAALAPAQAPSLVPGYSTGAAGWQGAPAAPSTFTCGRCGGVFMASEAVEIGGAVYCGACADVVAPAGVGLAGVAPAVAEPNTQDTETGETPLVPAAAGSPADAKPSTRRKNSTPAVEVMERCDGCGSAVAPTLLHPVAGKILCEACAIAAGAIVAPAPAPVDDDAVSVAPHDAFAQGDADHISMSAGPMAAGEAFVPSYAGRARKSDPTTLLVGAGVVAAAVVALFILLNRNNTPSTAVSLNYPPATVPSTAPASVPTTVPTTQSSVAAAWEKKNAAELRSLQRMAKSQADRKDLDAAAESYQQLFALAKQAPGGGLKDPALKTLLASATADWDKIKGQVKSAPAAPPADKAAVVKLLNEAQYAEKNGDKVAAFERYKEMFALLKGKSLKDADVDLKKKIAAATDARDKLFDELRSRKDATNVTAGRLLAQGYRALAAGKWEAALDTLYDVKLLMDRRVELNEQIKESDYVRAMHGIAVAYMFSGQFERGAQMFDDGATLGIVAETKPTRELLWNRGVLDVQQKVRALRTVIALMEFMKQDEKKVDEQLLNLFGTAIAVAYSQPGPKDPVLAEAVEYYKTKNAQLEATRSGSVHWGVQWLDGEEGKALLAKRDSAEKAFRNQLRGLESYEKRLKDVKRGERVPIRRGRSTIYVTRVNQDHLKAAQAEYDAKVKEVEAARAEIPVAQWLTDLKPMVPGAAGTAVAQGDPPGASEAGAQALVRTAVAFPIDRYRLLTAAAPLGNTSRVRLEDMLGEVLMADVVHKGSRLAVLEVSPSEAPGGLKYFNFAIGFSGGNVNAAAIPAPSSFGPIPELLKGEKSERPPTDGSWTVAFNVHPRLAGSPLLDETNRVIGVITARRDDPRDSLPAATLLEVHSFLAEANAMPQDESEGADPTGIYQVIIPSE